jgi:ribosomal protein L2
MFSARRGVGLLGICSSSFSPNAAAKSRPCYHFSNYAAEAKKPISEVNAALSRTSALFKTYKPITPGIRHLRRPLNPHLYKGRPVRLLTVAQRKSGGRNSHGHITVRHRGGGHKRRLRLVDFKREEPGPHDVVRIEYDPGRSAHIALVRNRAENAEGTKKWSYIVACEGMRAGDTVQSFRRGIPEGFVPGYSESKEDKSESSSLAIGRLRAMTIRPGNVLPLRLIPTGTVIHNIALSPRGPAILVRSAGSFGQIVAHNEGEKYTQVRLQSGEVRKVLRDCCATIGKVSNPLWKNRNLGKAGRARWLGRRPSVRGVAMNAYVTKFPPIFDRLILNYSNDHPHGGGRGKSKSNKHPVSIWGWNTKGKRTRKPGPKGPKNSNKMVIRERPRGKEKRSN